MVFGEAEAESVSRRKITEAIAMQVREWSENIWFILNLRLP